MSDDSFAANLAVVHRWRDDLAFQRECADRAARQRGEGAGVSRSKPIAVSPARPIAAGAPEDVAERRRARLALLAAGMQADVDRHSEDR